MRVANISGVFMTLGRGELAKFTMVMLLLKVVFMLTMRFIEFIGVITADVTRVTLKGSIRFVAHLLFDMVMQKVQRDNRC